MKATDEKSKYLPRTILLEDIDQALFDYVEKGNMKLIVDSKTVPPFFLNSDRWGELNLTWKLQDGDHNVPLPYITARRTEKAPGTRLGVKYHVPQSRSFRYVDVPILDAGEVIFLRFKMPEPTNVDLSYEIALFTKFREDVNLYDELVLRNFASRQEFLFINGSPMPIILEGLKEENTIENIDGDRFFVSKYTIKALAFIQDEKDFTIVKTMRKPLISVNIL